MKRRRTSRPRTAAQREAVRRYLARAQALGIHIGAPIRYHPREATCALCNKPFVFRYGERSYCSTACALTDWQERRRRLPNDADLLRWLYWDERMSTAEIGALFGVGYRAVVSQMTRLGVPRRGLGPRQAPHCIEPGCSAPVHKTKHSKNGALYGRRCRAHQKAHLAALNATRRRRRNAAAQVAAAGERA